MTREFDFFTGTWDVANRRLTERLAGCTDWEEFPGVAVGQLAFGGAAHIDEIVFPTKGWAGLTFRLFDPARETWSLYWVSSLDGQMQPPLVGRFTNGRGEFFSDDTFGGRPIRVRFIWSDITPTSARWEQAFSADGEQTWETNWFMAFTRR